MVRFIDWLFSGSIVEPARRTTYLVLFALWLIVFSASSQVIIVAPILPEISAALNVPDALQSWLVGIYAFFLCIFALITGPISDKIGRRKILLWGTAFMAFALWMHSIVQSFEGLLAMRALAGMSGGMLSGAAVAYVGDYFPYEQRGWANGWIMSGMAVGQILGIPIGKVLADAFGFRWPFIMFAATMTFATLLTWRYVPQPDVHRDAGILGVRRAIRNYFKLLKDGSVVAATVAYFLMFFGIGLFVVYFPTWLEVSIGLTAFEVAVLFFVGGAVNVVSSPAAGRLSDRVGRKPLIITSCVGLSVLMWITTYVVSDAVTAAALYGAAMLAVAMRISPLQSLMTALVPDHRRGILMSLAVGIGQLGIFGGSILAGLTYAPFGFWSNTVIGGASMVLMAWVVWRFLPEPHGDVKVASG